MSVHESVMAGHGFYSDHSRPQHAAAAVAYPYLQAAAGEAPIPDPPLPFGLGDLGCAGGANEMEPMGLAVEAVRARSDVPIQVVHTDIPENDFGPLFTLLAGPDGYPAHTTGAWPVVVGRTLYGPLVPDLTLHVAWSGITLQWLSDVPVTVPDAVYSNLVTGPEREAIRQRSVDDWHTFLTERARELVDGGGLVICAGASYPDGSSGAEALFTVIGEELDALQAAGTLRPGEHARIYYPTWNRTMDEWLAPFDGPLGEAFEVLDHRFDGTHDAETFAAAVEQGTFADTYVAFVRAITEAPFFRWLDADRSPEERHHVVEAFYDGLKARLTPDVAAFWHVASLRLRRRPR